jgi:hypothetical protein
LIYPIFVVYKPFRLKQKPKQMKFKSLLIALWVISGIAAQASPIGPEAAQKVAKNFLFEQLNQTGYNTGFSAIQVTDWWEIDQAYYVVNLNRGWVVVSQRTERHPIIGFNTSGNFTRPDEMDENIRSFMQAYVDEANYIQSNQIEPSEVISDTWDYYLTDDINTLHTEMLRDVDPPLLTNMWNQDYPYNIYCPVDPNGPGGHVYVGCVATAMSMIMHYWRYPLQGQGEHQYYASPYGMQYANFGETTYNWNGMQDYIDNTHPDDVALIGYHAAVSVNMMFAPDGSGAYSNQVPAALISRFTYSNQTQYLQKQNYPNSTWEAMLKDQLDASQPLYYSGFSSDGGGHAFVCDGYQGDNFYHFNFGWGGSNNGYYSLQSVGGFQNGQGIVRNFVPGDVNYPYIAEGETVLQTRSGSFTDGSGPAQDYPEGMDASWLIDPQSEVDSVVSIVLSFKKFNTAEMDMVKVYDGGTTGDPLLAEYSGSELPSNLTINNNKALVTFSSSSSAPGFVAEYKSNAPSWCSGTSMISEPFGTVEDGSGQYHYNNGTTCIQIIQVPEATTYTLNFNKFSTESENDVLRILKGNNQTVATLSGNDLPDPIEIETNMVVLAWSTNAIIRDEGWEIFYETDVTSVAENNVFEHFSIYPNPAKDLLHIGFSVKSQQQLQISLLNASGQQVYRMDEIFSAGDFNSTISLKGLAKGIYLMQLKSEQGLLTKKVVVK